MFNLDFRVEFHAITQQVKCPRINIRSDVQNGIEGKRTRIDSRIVWKLIYPSRYDRWQWQ